MNGTRTILGAEAKALRNRLMKRGPLGLTVLVIALLIGVAFIGGATFTAGAALGHLVPRALDAVLSSAFTALTVSMLVLGFPSVIATFFVGRDLLQLVVAPVRRAELFAARMVLAMGANLLLSAILLAGVLGLGAGAGAPSTYFLLAIPMVLVQVLWITSAQAICMSVVLRWVPARLARDVAAGVAGLAGAGLYLAWNLTLRGSFNRTSRPQVSSLTSLTKRIDWLPSAWPGHALSELVAGHASGALVWAVATLVLAALMVLAAELLYERTLLAGLGVFGSTPVSWRRKATRTAIRVSARGMGTPFRAIARKDWLGYRRDVRRLTRLLPALLFPIGYAVALSQPSRSVNGFWGNVFLVAFLSLFMSTALASPSIPGERRGFQLLRLAPVTMWQVLRAKVLLTLPPVLLVMLVFSGSVAMVSGTEPSQLAELGLLVLWLGGGFVAISVSAGGIDPRFDAVDDRRAVGFAGTLTGLFGALGFGALSIGAFASFIFGAEAAAGISQFGVIPPTLTSAVLLSAIGIVLLAGSVALVASLLFFAKVRLTSFEGAIAET